MAADDWMREVDIDRPSPARMYDYFLGGSHNFAADRVAAEQVIAAIPNVREIARANRAFLRYTVRHLVSIGIDQILDIGSGIPTAGNVHEIAHAINPDTRVVYVDTDPIAVAHSTRLLRDTPNAAAIRADLRQPAAILNHADLTATVDLTRPIALLIVSTLQFLTDAEAYPALTQLRGTLAAGSYLALSHVAAEGVDEHSSQATAEVYRRSTSPTGTLRTTDQIAAFFGDYQLIPPGLVWVSQWRPGSLAEVGPHPERIAMRAGVAHKAPPG